jgi:hypothetical protein
MTGRGASRQMNQKKRFFFEKKNQKTFAPGGACSSRARSELTGRFRTPTLPKRPARAKVFWFAAGQAFFQKSSASFYPTTN